MSAIARAVRLWPLCALVACSGGGSGVPAAASASASAPASGALPPAVASSAPAGTASPTPSGGPTESPTAPGTGPTSRPTATPSARPTPTPTSRSTGAPTAAPTATPTPGSVSAPGAATYAGCSIFPAGDWYNADVTNAAIDPNSADYIASLAATDPGNFYASVGIEQVNLATAATTQYTIHQKVSYHSFAVPEPWNSGFYIEPGGDGHSIVLEVTPPACHLYELYQTSFGSNVLSAYSGVDYDLSKPFTTLPDNTPSSMASGLSLFAGMVKYEEIAAGIHHALNISAYAHALCACFVAPASSSDGLTYTGPATSHEMPYGAHLRLRASFDDSGFGPQSKAIAEAMKRYGAFIADTSSSSNAVYTANPPTGGAWDGNDLSALASLRIRDFDVLPLGRL